MSVAIDPRGRDLLAQVYADPASDGPRIVYADWCLARGIPHGELILLQLARWQRPLRIEAVRRERELLAAHQHTWIASIWDAVHQDSVRFERGFLAHAKLGAKYPHREAEREWSTVTSIELPDERPPVIDRAHVPVLRELRNVSLHTLGQLARGPAYLEHLGTTADPVDVRSLLDADAFRELRSLGLRGDPPVWDWLWQLPIGPRIERLEIAGGYTKSPWLVPGRQLPRTVREVVVRTPDYALTCTRDDDAFPVAALTFTTTYVAGALQRALQVVPASLLRALTLRLRFEADAKLAHRLEMLARRKQRKLEQFTIQLA